MASPPTAVEESTDAPLRGPPSRPRASAEASAEGSAEARQHARLAHLLEASVTIANEPTFARIAQTASNAIGVLLDAPARVVLTQGGRVLARAPEEPLSSDGPKLTVSLPESSTGLSGELEALRSAESLETSEHLALAYVERVTLSSAERLYLLAEARQSARERQEIVAIVSHDLRTPLQTFAMGLDAIELSVGEAARKKIGPTTARMKRSIGTMTRLLGDLLDVSRIHDSVLPVKLAPHTLKVSIDEVRDLYLPMAEKSGLRLTVEVDPDLAVVCDGARISQALGNLLSNALRHTEQGTIAVRVREVGDRIRFEVEDTGVGIPAEVQARLFERLYQGESAGGRAGALGLGLYIVKGIVDAHGGTVGVESTVGRGTTFWFELPANRTAPSI